MVVFRSSGLIFSVYLWPAVALTRVMVVFRSSGLIFTASRPSSTASENYTTKQHHVCYPSIHSTSALWTRNFIVAGSAQERTCSGSAQERACSGSAQERTCSGSAQERTCSGSGPWIKRFECSTLFSSSFFAPYRSKHILEGATHYPLLRFYSIFNYSIHFNT